MRSNKTRWDMAQEYEKTWWNKRVAEIDLEFYERFAREVTDVLKPIIQITKDKFVLEIGSGAAGIITYIDSDHKYAIDPLENFYSSIPKYRSIRDNKVLYNMGMAEELPYEKSYFDLIIIDNVLDHCENPDLVLLEIQRVLKPGGIIFFKQNTYHLWGKLVREIMEKFKIDKGHPHTFMKKTLKKMFDKCNFKIIKYSRNGYFKTWRKEISSNRTIDIIKGLLFVNRDKTTYILKKT
jgi:ubiquinone/menaquinone biosynthesis C-methylase UbiE